MNANKIVDSIPDGYRWADEIESCRVTHPAYFTQMVRVRIRIPGIPAEESLTNYAIRRH